MKFIYLLKLLSPLLLLPLLSRRLSIDNYGIYMYCISFSVWLSMFVEYGFNVYSTREISSGDHKNIRDVVVSTQSAKTLLAFFLILPTILAVNLITIFDQHKIWGVVSWVLAVSTGLTPIYYFQGKERLKFVAISELIVNFFQLFLVFIFVNSDEDSNLLIVFLIAPRLFSTLILTFVMYKETNLKFINNYSYDKAIFFLKDGWNFFLLHAVVSLYTYFNVIFLGVFRSAYDVAVYASAERLIRGALGFTSQIPQAAFPRLNALNKSSTIEMMSLRKRILYAVIIISTLGALFTQFVSTFITKYFFGEQLHTVDKLIFILSFVIPAVSINSCLGFHFLVVNRQEKYLNRVIYCAAIVNFVGLYFSVTLYGALGAAFCWVFIEWLILICLSLIILNSNKNI